MPVETRQYTYLPPATLDTLRNLELGANLIEDVRQATLKSRVERDYFIIFETPAFLLALVATLFAEWYLRRRFNLL